MSYRDRWARLRAWYAAQTDRFVPPELRANADDARRAHVLVGFSLVCVVSGCVFTVLSIIHFSVATFLFASLVATVTSAAAPIVLRRTASLQVATTLMLAVFAVAIFFTARAAREQAAITLPWLAVLPLLATSLAGMRTGIVWLVVSVLLAELHLVLGEVWPPSVVLEPAAMLRASAWNLALLMTFVGSFALVYESRRRTMMSALALAEAELRSARERAVAYDRLASLGRMAAGVAHEINNPMTFVSSNVALLREDLATGPLEDAMRREYVEDILPATEEGIRRVIDITVDLRRFARGDSAQAVSFDLNQEVRTAVRMCEPTLGRRRVSSRLAALPPMTGRPRELVQVVMNLMVNALHAVGAEGQVQVETEVRSGQIVLRVTDDGSGMTDEVKARAFEPFFTTKPTGEGTGLGLAVVHGIVLAHGGALHIESQPGAGTTIEAVFPPAQT